MLLDLAKKVNGGGFWGAGGPFAVHVKTLAARGLVAHMDAANACGLVYCGSSSIFGHGGGAALEDLHRLTRRAHRGFTCASSSPDHDGQSGGLSG